MARSGAAATDHCSRQQLSAAKAGDEGLSEHTGNSTVYCGTLLFHPQRSHGLFGSERLHTTVGEESRGRPPHPPLKAFHHHRRGSNGAACGQWTPRTENSVARGTVALSGHSRKHYRSSIILSASKLPAYSAHGCSSPFLHGEPLCMFRQPMRWKFGLSQNFPIELRRAGLTGTVAGRGHPSVGNRMPPP